MFSLAINFQNLVGMILLAGFFVLSFVGNGFVAGMPVFYALLPLCLYFLVTYPVHRIYYIGFVFIVGTFLIDLSKGELTYFDAIWQIQMLLSVPVVTWILTKKNLSQKALSGWGFASLVLFLAVITVSMLFHLEGRAKFIFGPNVIYRIQMIFFIYSVYFLYGKIRSKWCFYPVFLFLFCLLGMGIYTTGSRGGLIVLASVMALFILQRFKKISIVVLIGALFLLLIFVGIDLQQLYEHRIFNFEAVHAKSSIGLRISAYIYAFRNMMEVLFSFGLTRLEFFYQFGSMPGFQYPHNLLLEFFIFYGWWGALFSAFIVTLYCKLLFKKLQGSLYADFMAMSAYLMATFFSGELGDNYQFLVFLFALYACQNILRKPKQVT